MQHHRPTLSNSFGPKMLDTFQHASKLVEFQFSRQLYESDTAKFPLNLKYVRKK